MSMIMLVIVKRFCSFWLMLEELWAVSLLITDRVRQTEVTLGFVWGLQRMSSTKREEVVAPQHTHFHLHKKDKGLTRRTVRRNELMCSARLSTTSFTSVRSSHLQNFSYSHPTFISVLALPSFRLTPQVCQERCKVLSYCLFHDMFIIGSLL